MKPILVLPLLLLAGCATRADVEREGVRATFDSNLSVIGLAACIDKNVDAFNSWMGSVNSKIIPGIDDAEVVVHSTGSPTQVLVVVKIGGKVRGARAQFFFGSLWGTMPEHYLQRMTRNCE